jgi:adenosylcobinamide kinase/adenosylcobinamide-phosphate guanylyltransferase
LTLAADSPQAFVMVSSEVGLSLVPPEPLGRQFQDLLGMVNQNIAASATEVYLVIAGISLKIKPAKAE